MLKVSGEQLGSAENNFDVDSAHLVCDVIEALVAERYSVACVMGGGNVVRGQSLHKNGFTNEVRADQMGMLATVQNGILLDEVLHRRKVVDPRLFSNVHVDSVEDFSQRRAEKALEMGRVVLISGGIGKPGLTTDTAVVMAAHELQCPTVIKTTKVDGIYDDDPATNPLAKRYDRLTYQEALANLDIKVMDRAALAFAADKNLTLAVCEPTAVSVLSLLRGETTHGTIVTN
jgi:uridylate kinase